MITLIILALLAGFIVIGWFVARRRQRAARWRDSIPLFTVPSASPERIARPMNRASRVAQNTPLPTHARPPAPVAADALDHEATFAPSAPTIRTRDGAMSTLARAPRGDHPTTPASGTIGEAIDGASVRYWRAADGTLQFLPGRLEIAAGLDAGQEIRFVRTAGPDGNCVTFGRAEGAPYRHVQLREPTVSRTHARMVFEQASAAPNTAVSQGSSGANAPRWRLENLSSTNPVVVNGRTLDSSGGLSASVILSEGDRIEMGEVAFMFHSR